MPWIILIVVAVIVLVTIPLVLSQRRGGNMSTHGHVSDSGLSGGATDASAASSSRRTSSPTPGTTPGL